MSHVSLQEFLKTEPDGTLEAIAEQYNTTLLEVVKNLPSPTVVSGDKFDTVWDTVCEWGNVTTLVHTTDVIPNLAANCLRVSIATAISTYAESTACPGISKQKTARILP